MRPRLFIMAGIPGSGKSTFAQRVFDPAKIVSTDEIRARLFPGDYDHTYNDFVFGEFHRGIENRLKYGSLAVADSTALTKSARDKLHEIAKEHGAEVHLILFTNTAQAKVNNHKRAERWVVPEDAMDYMRDKYNATLKSLRSGESLEYDSHTLIESVQ